MKERIQYLQKSIKSYNILYWENGKTAITDPEYDKLVEELKLLSPNDSLINNIETPTVLSSGKVEHLNPMLSLNKVYKIEELIKWCNKVSRDENEGFLIQPKYDGISAELSNGILSTRGNGIIGENISDKLPIIKIVSSGNIHDYVRGEILIDIQKFEEIKGEYKNPRNFVAGMLNRDDIDLSKGKFLSFVEFDISSTVFKLKEIMKVKWMDLIINTKKSGYPSDGLVIKIRDKQYSESLGVTSHHAKGEIALKFKNPEEKTVLLNCVLSPGKHNLTPVGKVKPVEISGVTVSNVNLHNYKYILDRDIQIGDTVFVERAGDVIPDIKKSIPGENRRQIRFSECPECGDGIEYIEPDLVCMNDNCIGKRVCMIMDSIRRIGIERLGEPTLRKILNTYDIIDLIDVFSLTKEDILQLDGFAETSAENLLNEINTVKENGVFEWQILASLNLNGIGETLSKDLLKDMKINDLSDMSYADFISIPGIGPERANVLVKGLHENSNYIERLFSTLPIKIEGKTMETLKGVVFTLTGTMPMGRKDIKKMIESKGGKVKGISKETNYLVCDDVSSGSGKVKKALGYGTAIMSFDQLMELLD